MMILNMSYCIVKRNKHGQNVISDGFVFRANHLCILVRSVRLLLMQELHGGGLMAHFGAKMMEFVLFMHLF